MHDTWSVYREREVTWRHRRKNISLITRNTPASSARAGQGLWEDEQLHSLGKCLPGHRIFQDKFPEGFTAASEAKVESGGGSSRGIAGHISQRLGRPWHQ
jgi:hypothetical protein